ncbi:hypothetical protein FSS13T_10640 [Flavobacterium saliperosum S13]|uniref:Uncharacterized protein n=2 Tax=Flavobacterium saliperosum TaxID=329186 RepID=A0A1G4VY65_9FLAO|nr:helix-turn-helix transcriptional regulator [Flavobacterium saliperosum]ESU26893.1 hypothetical protein FSS13T_10640 [Flavobacterium saliperosum S13]SCX13673.1 hypothetical protein SAMN02927925_01996 [Flavobacterium saliperosum]
MKKNATLKTLLGLSQEETAHMLGIERGQWSMFVSGKRDLPLAATQQLAVVLKHLQETKTFSKESELLTKTEQQQAQEKLQQDYRKVQIKQYKMTKQISTMENIRTECFAALEVAAFLEQQKESQTKSALIRSIRVRATNTLKKHNRYALTALQLKKETLESLQIRLEQKMKQNPSS